jgi:hypothetical protein
MRSVRRDHRTEHGGRIEGIHERARTIVNGLPGDRHVVSVHDTVDKPDEHPASDQRCLRVDDALEKCEIRVLRLDRIGVVTRDCVIGEASHERRSIVHCCVLERANADMARRDTGEHRAGQHRIPRDVIAGRHHSERPGSGDA